MDEIEEYRKGIERRYHERRQLKNSRRQRRTVRFWDIGFIINLIILFAISAWLYLAAKFSGGTNG